MNNLVIYNEAEINSVEICVLPPLFKVKVAMDSDTDATVTITDINDAEDFASVCIGTNRNEFPTYSSPTRKGCVSVGRWHAVLQRTSPCLWDMALCLTSATMSILRLTCSSFRTNGRMI